MSMGRIGCCALKGLDLDFLVDREHDGIVRRVHVQPNYIAYLRHQLGASAHANTIRARNATARFTRVRLVKRINSARSLSVSTTSALGRPIFAMFR